MEARVHDVWVAARDARDAAARADARTRRTIRPVARGWLSPIPTREDHRASRDEVASCLRRGAQAAVAPRGWSALEAALVVATRGETATVVHCDVLTHCRTRTPALARLVTMTALGRRAFSSHLHVTSVVRKACHPVDLAEACALTAALRHDETAYCVRRRNQVGLSDRLVIDSRARAARHGGMVGMCGAFGTRGTRGMATARCGA
mmetsp:Transcript_39951/g.105573  ORF Transcript_39951/g.105573 Transcript_39951/m.105573 type:complete len:206 (-) Transcript_39951:229-846(-)